MSTFPQYSFKNINASGTTVVSKGPGVLHTVNMNAVNERGSTLIYDGLNTSGTLIATLGSSTLAGASAIYDVRFNALTVVVNGNQDVTLSIG